MTTLKRYRADAFRQFQKAMMKVRGGEMQVELLQAAKEQSGNDFANWLEAKMRQCAGSDNIIIGDEEPPLPRAPVKYTAPEFIEPTSVTIRYMCDAWQTLTPGVACRAPVWAYIVVRMIAADMIKPHYLITATNRTKTDGSEEIGAALNTAGDKRAQAIDKCVRAFLRRLSGLLERGARSIYQNCPPARAWWQNHIAMEAVQNAGCEEKPTIKLLKAPLVWELLSDKMASQLTVIADLNLRDGIIMFLQSDSGARFRGDKKTLNSLLRGIGIMSAWRALGIFPPKEVEEILRTEIAPNIPDDSAPAADNVKSDNGGRRTRLFG